MLYYTTRLPQFRDCITHFLIAEFYPTVQLKYLPGTVKFCVDPVRLFGCIFYCICLISVCYIHLFIYSVQDGEIKLYISRFSKAIICVRPFVSAFAFFTFEPPDL